jgi:hypothetical protein
MCKILLVLKLRIYKRLVRFQLNVAWTRVLGGNSQMLNLHTIEHNVIAIFNVLC